MSAAHDGGPAFPMQDPQAIHAYAAAKVVGIDDTDARDRVYMQARAEAVGGMSLRDYFAAKAMAAQIQYAGCDDVDDDPLAAWSYDVADAMLKARNS